MEPVIHRHFIDRLAFVNSLISGVALYPQVWAVFHSGSAENLSAFTYTLILLNSLIWVLYAIHRGLLSLGLASVLNALASMTLLIALGWF